MKFTHSYLPVLLAFSLFALPGCNGSDGNPGSPGIKPPASLLADPGFETGVSGFYKQDAADSMTRSTNAPIAGTASLLLGLNSWGSNVWWDYPVSGTPQQNAKTFTVTAKTKGLATSTDSPLMVCADATYSDSQDVSEACTPANTVVGVVSTVTATVNVDPSHQLGMLSVRLTLQGAQPIQYSVDDVLAYVGVVPLPTPMPVPTATPTPTVTPTSTPTVTPKPTVTPTPLPTVTPQPTITPKPTVTPKPTPIPTPTPTVTPPVGGPSIQLGQNANMGGFRPFPATNPWNQDVSRLPVDPSSDLYVNSIGAGNTSHADFGTVWNGAPIGNPYIVVPGNQPKVPVSFTWASESDPGPYPIPANAQIEQGPNATGDRHVIVIDRDNLKLYELYRAFPQGDGSWKADAGAVFDLKNGTTRPTGWTSADAAGLPIYPGLARYDEIMLQGELTHALRFTAQRSQNGYVAPASHAAGTNDPTLPPMGMRVRMKASYDCSAFSVPVQTICRGLKKYGMILADNGGDWEIAGAPNPLWNDSDLHDLTSVPGNAFEVVKMGSIIQQN